MGSKGFTSKSAENAKPQEKPYKLATGRGFYLYIVPSGQKSWRYDYRLNGKRNTVTYGKFPVMGLHDADVAHIECKKLIAQGIDPNNQKKIVKDEKERQAISEAMTFERVALEWLAKRMADKSERYRHDIGVRLQSHILPYIGAIPIIKLEARDLLLPVRKVEDRGAFEMAHRLAQIIRQVCRFAKIAGYVKHNEAADITEALAKKPPEKHRAAILDPDKFGVLLNDIDGYGGDISTKYALKILPYVFVRSSELRGARWAEFDLAGKQWLIPAERMKMKRAHIVPLASQVITLLNELKEWTGEYELLFPGSASKTRQITDVCLLNALRRMGYGKDQVTVHGFRSTASTFLNEQGYRKDVIEMQLAHKETNRIREAYNHALYLPERITMMQEWADFLDRIKGIQNNIEE